LSSVESCVRFHPTRLPIRRIRAATQLGLTLVLKRCCASALREELGRR
jgi:hypothetical protein